MAHPRIPPTRRKRHCDIFYTSRVIADFVPNFVAMATAVGRGTICLDSFNSPTPKNPCYTQKSRGYILYKPRYSRFCPKFCFAMATGVGRGRICMTSFNSPTPKTSCTQKSRGCLLYQPSYSRFCPKFRCHGNGGLSW